MNALLLAAIFLLLLASAAMRFAIAVARLLFVVLGISVALFVVPVVVLLRPQPGVDDGSVPASPRWS